MPPKKKGKAATADSAQPRARSSTHKTGPPVGGTQPLPPLESGEPPIRARKRTSRGRRADDNQDDGHDDQTDVVHAQEMGMPAQPPPQ